MTVATTIAKATFPWTGFETSFPCGFPARAKADLDVNVAPTGVIGAPLPLSLGVHYDVALDPATNMATLLPVALSFPAGVVTVERNTALTQDTIFSDGESVPSPTHEDVADKAAMRDQDLRRDVDAAQATADTALANANTANGTLIDMLASGGPVVTIVRGENWPTIFDYMDTAIADSIKRRDPIDHGAAVQSAANAKGAGTLWLPDGAYYRTDSFVCVNGQTVRGGAKTLDGSQGVIIGFLGTIDQPLISVRAGGAGGIKGCMLIAGATAATPNQKLVDFDGLTGGECDGFELEDVALFGGYKQLCYRGICFYQRILNCTSSLAYKRVISVEGTIASAGVDIYAAGNHIRGGLPTMDHVWYLLGLGSLVTVGNIITVCPAQSATVMLDTLATGFGNWLSTNDVYESAVAGVPALKLGTSMSQVKQLYFANLDAGGGIDLVNVDVARISGPIASLRANGEIYIPANGTATNIKVDAQFDGDGTKAPVQCGANATIGMSLVAPTWKGAAPLVDLTATSAANIAYLDVIGGNKGANGTPIRLPAGAIAGLRG